MVFFLTERRNRFAVLLLSFYFYKVLCGYKRLTGSLAVGVICKDCHLHCVYFTSIDIHGYQKYFLTGANRGLFVKLCQQLNNFILTKNLKHAKCQLLYNSCTTFNPNKILFIKSRFTSIITIITSEAIISIAIILQILY